MNTVREDIIESTVTAHVHMPIPTKALIDWVNQAYETPAISYWTVGVKDLKRAPLEIGGLEHNYAYEFKVKAYEGQWHHITVQTILNGIERLLSTKVRVSTRQAFYILQGVNEACTEGTGAIDSDALDCIVQAGLFNEVIYG